MLLKVEDAARLLGVGRTTFFELISQGRIQTVRVGRRRLVVRAGLERFVEEISS
ncbi:MAG: excisionase family DNA-binding protein [Acidimicrobiales bacterium]